MIHTNRPAQDASFRHVFAHASDTNAFEDFGTGGWLLWTVPGITVEALNPNEGGE